MITLPALPWLAKVGPALVTVAAKVFIVVAIVGMIFMAGAWWKESNINEQRLEDLQTTVRAFQTTATRQALDRAKQAKQIADDRRTADEKFRRLLAQNAGLKAELDRFLTVGELEHMGVCGSLPECQSHFGRPGPDSAPPPDAGGIQDGHYWPRVRAAIEAHRELDDLIRADNLKKQQLREQLGNEFAP
jgi:hypothetical protein